MPIRCLVLVLLLILAGAPHGQAANPVKMRPYSGVGVLLLPGTAGGQKPNQPVYLYREARLVRFGELDATKLAANQWIFGPLTQQLPLIVTARKGDWLQICYDDAGREAWVGPQRRNAFQSWEMFFKSRMSRILPGLRKQYYQLYGQPEQNPGDTLAPNQAFRVLKLENDWGMVLYEQTKVGWLRWRDEDGRLTIGLALED